MALNGIASLLYGVNDVAECTRYFEDFGLPLLEKSDQHARFLLEEGSDVIIRHISDPAIPKSGLNGIGVHETIWGVDNEESLERLVKSLAVDHEIRRDADGTVRFLSPIGLAMGLRVFRRNPILAAPDPTNAPGRVNRLNQHRKWKLKARPKCIQHVVFAFADYEGAWAYFRDRLGFKLTDIQRGFGFFGRCDGSSHHHNIYTLNANLPFPGLDGTTRFNHTNFEVEDLDEVMVGTNHMERQGWPKSVWGLGRHRIASALFMYLPCPAGGDAEYGTDSDVLDDNWIPRTWDARFGTCSFMHNLPVFLKDAPPWDVQLVDGHTPQAVPRGTNPGHLE